MKFVLAGVGIAAVAAVVFGVYVFLDSAFAQQKRVTAEATDLPEVRQAAALPDSAQPAPPPETTMQASPATDAAGELFPNVPPVTATAASAEPPATPAEAAPTAEVIAAEPAPAELPPADPAPVAPAPEPIVADPRSPAEHAPQPPGAPLREATGSPLPRTPALAASAPKPADAPAPANPEPPRGTAQWHAHRGRELLVQGKAKASMEEFINAARLDRDCADAHHGIGLAYAALGNSKLAIERLEKAVTLYEPPNRAAVFNLAAAHLKNNPMRAVKIVKDYLARPDSPNDEELHNIMGAALWRVDAQGRQNRAFAEAENFYFAYNARLETGRTDERKRWGSEWVSASEATRKWNDYRAKRQNVERLRVQHGRAAKAAKDAHNKVYEYASDLKLHSDMEKRRVRQNYEVAVKRVDALRQQVLKAEQEFSYAEKPPLPQIVPHVPMDPVAASPGASPASSPGASRGTEPAGPRAAAR